MSGNYYLQVNRPINHHHGDDGDDEEEEDESESVFKFGLFNLRVPGNHS